MHTTIINSCVFFCTKNEGRVFVMNKKDRMGNIENGEDVTKYGEFVSSYFAWLTLEHQKENANKMEDMTKK